jgi:hypothetical protein
MEITSYFNTDSELNMSDITSRFHAITTFVITELQATVVQTQFVGIFLHYCHKNVIFLPPAVY